MKDNVEVEGLVIGETNTLNNNKRPVIFGIDNNVSGNSTNVLILGRGKMLKHQEPELQC